MLRKIRISLATLFFIGLTLLLLDFTGVLHAYLGWMAQVQFLPAVLRLGGDLVAGQWAAGPLLVAAAIVLGLVLLTFVFGRLYCSVVCPLGVMQDVVGWLSRKRKKRRYRFSPEKKWLRYGVLSLFGAGLVLSLLTGIGIVVQLLAPYSAFGRIVNTLLQPLWKLGNNVLASIAERADSYAFYPTEVWVKSVPVLIIAVVTLVVVAVLAWRGGRTYCNTICPVGTVLSFIARHSLLKIHIDTDKCRNCSLCARSCKAACIDFKNHRIDYSRCVVCGDCIEHCHEGALSYGWAKTEKTANKSTIARAATPTDAGKRSFLLASAMLTTAAIAQEKKKVDGGLAELEDKKPPRRGIMPTPPGSLSVRNMAQRCTGCQLCVSACPNGVLRPSVDLMHLMQPTMSFEHGYCRPECTRCSEVCPTGAIRPIDKEEKTTIQTGHAIVAPWLCLPSSEGVECGNCARHCPAGAITMVPSDPDDDLSPSVPSVDTEACIGCGACEYLCPVRPQSAIFVEGHEVHKTI